MKKYLQIIHKKSEIVIKRFDVTDKTERSIDRLEDAVNINLNHNEYKTDTKESETELELEPKVDETLLV